MSAILTILGRATRDPEMQQGKIPVRNMFLWTL
ncbi:hypothetical protein OBE_03944, partial [human gut metagenome]